MRELNLWLSRVTDDRLGGQMRMSDAEPKAPSDIAGKSMEAPEVVEELTTMATAAGASDIHLQMRGAVAEVFFRLDGVLSPVRVLPEGLAERVFGRIKFLSKLKTYQDNLPQDGRIDASALPTGTDMRVATYPTITGEKIVLRLFQAEATKELRELEFPPDVLEALERFLSRPSGLLLLTGPAGSGKTTTIYACVRALAQRKDRHIITVEDPAEQIIPGIMQTEVRESLGLTFATAARHLLRQDPQVLVIGEIRDEETANLVVRAALTGHLVISTLHAGSCEGVFERLGVLCKDVSAVSSSLELVINQRLIRKLCDECSGASCATCLTTGFRGRLPIVEFVAVTPPLRAAFAAGNLEKLRPAVPLEERVRALVTTRRTSADEAERVLGKHFA